MKVYSDDEIMCNIPQKWEYERAKKIVKRYERAQVLKNRERYKGECDCPFCLGGIPPYKGKIQSNCSECNGSGKILKMRLVSLGLTELIK